MIEITDAVKNVQAKLSQTGVRFLEYIQTRPEASQYSQYHLMELNDKVFKLQPWPTFINREIKTGMERIGITLLNLIKGIPGRFFHNDVDAISRYFAIPPERVEWHLDGVTDEHLDNLLARGDFMFSDSGFKCLEYNVTPHLGGWQVPLWESLYFNTPVIGDFFRQSGTRVLNENFISLLFGMIIKRCLKKFRPKDHVINTAMVIPPEDFNIKGFDSVGMYMNQIYTEQLKAADNRLTGEIVVNDGKSLDVRDETLYIYGKKITALIELFHGVIPEEIFIPFKAGNMCLYNGPVTELLSNKLTLAWLSENLDSEKLSSQEKEIIANYIPWTRKTIPGETIYNNQKIKLEHFMMENRENLIMKPSEGYGGFDICMGKSASPKEWKTVVERALDQKTWLVQEVIQPLRFLYQLVGADDYDYHDPVWGFFVFGDKYAGQWVRVMPQQETMSIINCHQGATVSVVFEVDDKDLEKPGTQAAHPQFTAELKENHRALASTSSQFLDFALQNPGCLERSNFETLKWHDEKIKLQSWPTFINQHTRQELEAASIELCGLIKNIPRRFFDGDPAKMSDYYAMPRDLMEIQWGATNDKHIQQLTARGDFVFHPGGLKCLEFNVSSDLGGLENPIFASMYLEVPLIKQFIQQNNIQILQQNIIVSLFEYLIATAREQWSTLPELNIAFVIPRYGQGTSREREKEYLNQCYSQVVEQVEDIEAGEILFCDYHHIDVDADRVSTGGKRIHVLLELQGGNVLPEIVNRFHDGHVLMFNGPITRLLSNKLNLALLSEEAGNPNGRLTAQERETVQNYIPWSRKLVPGPTTYRGSTVKMENFVMTNKENLVLKPPEGYGGIGVFVGKTTPSFQWKVRVKKAMAKKNFLLQEYVESTPYLYQSGVSGAVPFDTVWGTFILGSLYAGAWVRMMPQENSKRIVNTEQGAEESVVFEVNEQ